MYNPALINGVVDAKYPLERISENLSQTKNEFSLSFWYYIDGWKYKYNETILDYISEKELDNVTIKISDGKLKFVDTNYSQPLTYKYIYECLNKYYRNENKALELINFIKTERSVKTVREIKRFGQQQ